MWHELAPKEVRLALETIQFLRKTFPMVRASNGLGLRRSLDYGGSLSGFGLRFQSTLTIFHSPLSFAICR